MPRTITISGIPHSTFGYTREQVQGAQHCQTPRPTTLTQPYTGPSGEPHGHQGSPDAEYEGTTLFIDKLTENQGVPR